MTDFLMVPEFVKELKRFQKRYRNLEDDLKNFRTVLKATLPSKVSGTFQISNLGEDVTIPFYKVKHFRSRDFPRKGVKSGFRIIYTYIKEEDKVYLIEIFHKNKKENEDRQRIIKYNEILASK